MTPRLHITAEGQTEERYAQRALVPHLGYLGDRQVVADVRCVKTGRKRDTDYRGGVLDYRKARLDIVQWMKENDNTDSFFTTMFDLYALPEDFPGYAEALRETDCYRRAAVLEKAMEDDLAHRRFVPYIQLHEFEALLLADPSSLRSEYLEHEAGIAQLIALTASRNPEEINDGPDTAPSKRIILQIPAYRHQKASVGPLVAAKIGLETLRRRCHPFNDWVTRLESLSA
jgi:hypothetical protein